MLHLPRSVSGLARVSQQDSAVLGLSRGAKPQITHEVIGERAAATRTTAPIRQGSTNGRKQQALDAHTSSGSSVEAAATILHSVRLFLLAGGSLGFCFNVQPATVGPPQEALRNRHGRNVEPARVDAAVYLG